MRRELSGLLTLALLTASSAGAAEKKCVLQSLAELPVTMAGTRPLIAGTIDGKPARFLADSGAFFSLLTRESAERHGLKLGPVPGGMIIRGVGGVERMQLTKVPEFGLTGFAGGYAYKKVDFLVSSIRFDDIDGIIGQNFIGTMDTEYDLANGFIRIFKATDCKGAMLAYWADNVPVAELSFKRRTPAAPHLITTGRINGKKIRVMLDTGAFRSILTLRAAAKAGIEPEDDEVSAAGLSRGIGKQASENSLALFDTLDLGGEVIKNARLRIGTLKISETADMLLGADFFLSHRIYVDSRANKVYFTYNGGPVFDLGREDDSTEAQLEPTPSDVDTEPELTEAEPSAALPEVAGSADATNDATPQAILTRSNASQESAMLRRRGAASAGRRDFAAAIADFDRAIQLDPADAENYYQRGLAYAQTKRGRQALADLDQALKLKPDDIQSRMARGAVNLALDNDAAASEDFAAAQRLAPSNTQLPLEAARSFGAAGKFTEAIARLDGWLERHPSDPQRLEVIHGRCRLRAMANLELELALADCDEVLKRKAARTSVTHYSRGLVHLRLGNHDKAIDDFDAALKRQPKDASSLYGRGLAALSQGRNEEGELDLAAAVAIDAKVEEQYTKMGLTR